MHPATATKQDVLASNLLNHWEEQPATSGDQEAFTDLAFGVGLLALLVTGIIAIGHQFGGPAPRPQFWTTFAPLLLVPLLVLLAIALAPGGLLRDESAGALRRIRIAGGAAALFVLVMVLLNAPALLVLAR
jgi:tellurite resistance protein TehA-like permease